MKDLTRRVILSASLVIVACSSTPDLPPPQDPVSNQAATNPDTAEPTPFDPSVSPDPEAPPVLPPPPEMGGEAEVTPKTPDKPVEKKPAPNPSKQSGILEEVEGQDALRSGEVAVNPAFTKLDKCLTELGYHGVGLEYESSRVLVLLYEVFSHPDSKLRKIQRVYTGGAMEYDPKAEALTIGGTSSKAKILSFLKKKVPRRKP